MCDCTLAAFSPQVVVKWLPHPKAGPISSDSAEWDGLFQPHRRLICSEQKCETGFGDGRRFVLRRAVQSGRWRLTASCWGRVLADQIHGYAYRLLQAHWQKNTPTYSLALPLSPPPSDTIHPAFFTQNNGRGTLSDSLQLDIASCRITLGLGLGRLDVVRRWDGVAGLQGVPSRPLLALRPQPVLPVAFTPTHIRLIIARLPASSTPSSNCQPACSPPPPRRSLVPITSCTIVNFPRRVSVLPVLEAS